MRPERSATEHRTAAADRCGVCRSRIVVRGADEIVIKHAILRESKARAVGLWRSAHAV